MSTKIEWCDETWNPTTGCTKVSAGCKHCYAERQWKRLSAPGMPYAGRAFTDVALHPDRLDQPLRWRKPRRVFVNSMSDLFHPDVPDRFIDLVFAVMALASQHTFQVLTKRPERMQAYMTRLIKEMGADKFPSGPVAQATSRISYIQGDPLPMNAPLEWVARGCPPPHIWLGVSIEDQPTADERADLLRQTPAEVRFLSVEPMLGPVAVSMDGIDWVICGGESGPKARPMHPDWARSLRDQCVAAGVPFFFKQWGEWAPSEHFPSLAHSDARGRWVSDYGSSEAGCGHPHPADYLVRRVGKKAAGRLLDGRTWDE